MVTISPDDQMIDLIKFVAICIIATLLFITVGGEIPSSIIGCAFCISFGLSKPNYENTKVFKSTL